MRFLAIAVVMCAATIGTCAPPDAPKEIEGKAGKVILFDVKGEPGKVAFAPGFDKAKCPVVRLHSDDPTTLSFMAIPEVDGEYILTFWTQGDKTYTQTKLKIGKGVPPNPIPDPVPPVPDTVGLDGPVWVYLVEETSQRTPALANIILDVAFWNDLETKGYKMRPYDRDSADAKKMKLDNVKDKNGNALAVPYLVFTDKDGKNVSALPLPTSTQGIKSVLPKIKVAAFSIAPPVETVTQTITSVPQYQPLYYSSPFVNQAGGTCVTLPNGRVICR